MTADPVAEASRSAAAFLAADLGQNLPSQVEAALATRDAARRPDQFLDPVALGGLVVSVATLAWTVYTDLRSRAKDASATNLHEEPEVDAIARRIRNELRQQDIALPPGTERITQVVVTEIIRHSKASDE